MQRCRQEIEQYKAELKRKAENRSHAASIAAPSHPLPRPLRLPSERSRGTHSHERAASRQFSGFSLLSC